MAENFSRRDAAFTLDARASNDDPENPSPIMAVFSAEEAQYIDDALYILKTNSLFKIQTADVLDPLRTNPQVPHQQRQIAEVGTSAFYVARSFYQAERLSKKIIVDRREANIDLALEIMFSLMLELVTFDENLRKLNGAIKSTSTKAHDLVNQASGRNVIPNMPSVPGLRNDIRNLILQAKKALAIPAYLLQAFFGKEFCSGHYHKACEWSAEQFGEEDRLTLLLQDISDYMKYIIALRSGVEHERRDQRLIIEDISLSLDQPSELRRPYWRLVHPQFQEDEVDVSEALEAILVSIVDAAEALFLLCLMYKKIEGPFKFEVFEIDEDSRNPEAPIRYDINAYKMN